MKSLPRGDQIDAMIGQPSRFGPVRQAYEVWILLEQYLGRLPHFLVGFHSINEVALTQQHLGQNARAGANIGNNAANPQPAFISQTVDDGRRITGTISQVLLDSL